MAEDFLSKLIGNSKRARIIRIFIFNPTELYSARLLGKRAGVSVASAASEVHFLESAGIIKKGRSLPAPARALKQGRDHRKKSMQQKEKAWSLNQNFQLLRPLTTFVHEVSPVHYQSILKMLQK